MIISGAFGRHVLPRVHNMCQVDSIFIFCGNPKNHEKWTHDWPKIKGVFTEIQPICEALKQAARQCEQNAISISIMSTTGDVSKKELNQLNASFMYTQIMKEVLLTIEFEQQHIQEFVDYCRDVLTDNKEQLKNVDKLEQKYREHTPIWWYTYECFLYPMLNRALRLTDPDLIIKLGFFISDLHRQIEHLQKEQFDASSANKSFSVYRGQGMIKEQFEEMTANTGGLLSFNCFLSTSRDRNVSLDYAQRSMINSDMVGVLFVMTIDHTQSATPFASIIDVSCYGEQEAEVLFSMHTVFRIGNITPIGKNNRLFQVDLILTSDNDEDFRQLTDHIRKETFPDTTGWYRLALVLMKMGQYEKAQRVYELLLKQETDASKKAPIYNQLGSVKYEQGKYEEALRFYEKSIEIEEKCKPLNHQNLANSYNNIGVMYDKRGEYPKALSYYEKALEIKQQSLSPNHPSLASSYNNIALVYHNMNDHPKALSSHEKALAIQQQSLPPNHPDLATSYNNIGIVYRKVGEYPKALSSHEKALAIQQRSLLPNHPELASSHNNIGTVYNSINEYPKALLHYEKALAIQQQLLSSNHPNLASSYNNIGLVYCNMGDYSKALSSHEKALAIQQQSLPSNHPDLASSYNNIGGLYGRMSEYSKALPYFEKSLEIKQQTLPPNHPSLASTYDNIGTLHENMKNYSKARSCFERAIDIGQHSLPSGHPNIQRWKKNLERVKKL